MVRDHALERGAAVVWALALSAVAMLFSLGWAVYHPTRSLSDPMVRTWLVPR